MQVKLIDIIDGIEMQSEASKSSVNLETGEVINVADEALMMAEEEIDHLPNCQQDEVNLAIDILGNFDIYATLPTSYDVNEYSIMERFCFSLDDQKQDILLNAIHGRGAFRRFKDKISRFGIEDQWYEFQ